ncbi:MAG: hypothetical protein FJX77_05655, partial [Armatimonadetes bacterium]|nr:hypothetical protein [Armatimonadota bacterium]
WVTTEVYTFEHSHFEPGFSGNTIRVCPVGALMSKPFRFRSRPWELQKTPGLCGLCSVGCNVRQDVRENQLLRVVGIENPRVNDGWLCDRGQFGYDFVNHPDRLSAPLLRRPNGNLEEVSWEEALSFIAGRLKELCRAGAGVFGALASDRATNEDLFVLQKFTREVIGSPNLDHRNGSTRHNYDSAIPTPGALQALGEADVVFLLGTDLTADAPVLDLILKRGLLPRRMKLIQAYPRRTRLNPFVNQWLRHIPGQEITTINALCKVLIEEELVPPAVVEEAGPAWEALNLGLSRSVEETCRLAGLEETSVRAAARLIAGAKRCAILFGQEPVDARDGPYVLAALENLSVLAGHSGRAGRLFLEVVQQANTLGARALGVLPIAGPGGRRVPRGQSSGEMFQSVLDGKLQALFLLGANPLVDHPGHERVRNALQQVQLLVVADQFLTETGAQAHVVLPSAALTERNGTLTNVEGRIQKTIRAMAPRGGARPDWEVLLELAEVLGAPLPYNSLRDVQQGILDATQDPAASGPRRLQRVESPMAPNTDANYPLRLYTSRMLFDRGTLACRSRVLPGLCPEPFVELHPADAERMGIRDGEQVTVTSPYGKLSLTAHLTEDTLPGSAFVPTGYNQAPAAHLWVEGAHVIHCRVSRSAAGTAAAPGAG